ncbi:MAG: prolipoprotein diacylglyceryl transferase [Bacteroidales bacterium]|nr:prolipoprotein diacylglyceryl transferase [Bacteroidales bacterium]
MISNYINWNIEPTLSFFGLFPIKLYALFFSIGIILGLLALKKIIRKEQPDENWVNKFFVVGMITTILFARLFHVFFYNWSYYSQNLFEIFKTWHGGLASHGGAFGGILIFYIFSRFVIKKNILWIYDRMMIPAAIAAIFIRIGNLFNSEIYGIPTDLPWAFVFEELGDNLPRHPVQLYEAIAYFITLMVLYYAYTKKNALKKSGLLAGIFGIGVFIPRFLIEFVKAKQESFELPIMFNMGQLLTIPFILLSFYLLYKALIKK